MGNTAPMRATPNRSNAESTIILKKPTPSDKDTDRLVLVNNLDERYITPQGVTVPAQVLESFALLGPMAVAVYIASCYWRQKGERVTPLVVAEFVGCHKVTAKRELRRLEMLGILDLVEQEETQ